MVTDATSRWIGTRKVWQWASSLTTLLTIFLVCSVLINVLLARKVARLANNIRVLKSEGQLATGSTVPAIEAKDLSGKPAFVSYMEGDIPTVLYVFTPSCRWCERNFHNVQTLVNETHGKYRFVGLSLSRDNLNEYVLQHDYGFPIYTDLPSTITSTYKMGGTPQTIVVSSDGKVVNSWMGAYSGSLKQEVETFFGVDLPGITEQEDGSRN